MSAPIVCMTFEGEPVSKGRPRVGKGGVVYTPQKTRAAEQAIAWSIRAAHPGLQPAIGDVDVVLRFAVSDYRRRDIDNLAKLVLDACNGIAWADDAQVVGLQCILLRGSEHPFTSITVLPVPAGAADINARLNGHPPRAAR